MTKLIYNIDYMDQYQHQQKKQAMLEAFKNVFAKQNQQQKAPNEFKQNDYSTHNNSINEPKRMNKLIAEV